MDSEREGCCFDEWAKRNAKRARRKETVAGVTRPLLTSLVEAGLEGRSVLDVGCGVGDLARATLARGATLATGIDLSKEAIEEARALAHQRGVEDRTEFDVGDGATTRLAPHDVVVLNRVFCCYPDVDGLLENSLAAARSVYAFTTPPSTGVAGAFVRTQIAFANAWYRLRRRKFGGFRVFVHDVSAIDARVRAAGFRMLTAGRRRFVWHLAVYARPR